MRSAALPSTRESDIRTTIDPRLLIREISFRDVLRTAVALPDFALPFIRFLA
jgi:hypothetical protein